MAFDINTNMNALYAQSSLSAYGDQNQNSVNLGDLAISLSVQQETAMYGQGMNNAIQGEALIQTATGGLEQTQSILQQMNTLATESASGVLSSTQLSGLQTEYSQLQSEVNNIAGTTIFNGISLLQNQSGSITIQTGNSSSTVTVNLPQTDTTSLGIASTDVSSTSDASAALNPLNNAINNISNDLAQLGSAQINLQNQSKIDTNTVVNLATENVSFSSIGNSNTQIGINSVLPQANILMLVQANGAPQYALQLLSNYQNQSANVGTFVNLQA